MTKEKDTNITQAHRDAFNALTSGKYNNFALFSCFVNGEPASAIAVVNEESNGDFTTLLPLFVSVCDGMTLTDHDGEEATDIEKEVSDG